MYSPLDSHYLPLEVVNAVRISQTDVKTTVECDCYWKRRKYVGQIVLLSCVTENWTNGQKLFQSQNWNFNCSVLINVCISQ